MHWGNVPLSSTHAIQRNREAKAISIISALELEDGRRRMLEPEENNSRVKSFSKSCTNYWGIATSRILDYLYE
jgi:hypothetical protein